MKLGDLKSTRAGRLVECWGTLAFVPYSLPVSLNFAKFEEELLGAEEAVGELSSASREGFEKVFLLLEGTYSAKIEGSEATPRTAAVARLRGGLRVDEREALNAAEATKFAWEVGRELGALAKVVIRSLHEIVMSKVRGSELGVGEFKSLPNFSGGPDIVSAKMVYTPPAFVEDLVNNLITFVNASAEHPLITAGLAHYQFEAIHPFPDGNGRVGRALIHFVLSAKGALGLPYLPISRELWLRRGEYISALDRVSLEGDYEGWLRFFLGAVSEAARWAKGLLERMKELPRVSLEEPERLDEVLEAIDA